MLVASADGVIQYCFIISLVSVDFYYPSGVTACAKYRVIVLYADTIHAAKEKVGQIYSYIGKTALH